VGVVPAGSCACAVTEVGNASKDKDRIDSKTKVVKLFLKKFLFLIFYLS
jgi:hypothetical protein